MPTIRDLRKKKGWSQEMLAEKAGISQSLLSALELGERTSEDNALTICQALGVPLDEVEGLSVKAKSPLHTLREAKGFSREVLAKQAGISLSTLMAMENKGKGSRKSTAKVCQVLGVPLDEVEDLKINPGAEGASPLRDLREKRHWTQVDLVEKAGVSLPVVVKIEKSRPVTHRSALKVCQVLGVPLDEVKGLKIYSPTEIPSSFPLRALREAKGWSQRQLALKVGVSITTITDMEQGRVVNRLGMLLTCQALGISVEELTRLNLFSQKEVEWYRFLLWDDCPQETYPLRVLRKAKGWKTQEALANAADVSPEVIWRAETGKNINRMSALKICQTLGVPLTHVEGLQITSSMRGEAWNEPLA